MTDSPESLSEEDTVLHVEAANPANAITKSQCRLLTKRLAHGLRQNYGIGSSGPNKDVVVVISSGQILLPVLFWAVICAGGVYSAANTSFTVLELARQIKQGQGNLIACSEDTKDVAIAAAKECGISLDRVLLLTSDPRGLRSVEGNVDCMSDRELDWIRITDPQELENSVICLLYSSGTTGIPKGMPSFLWYLFYRMVRVQRLIVCSRNPCRLGLVLIFFLTPLRGTTLAYKHRVRRAAPSVHASEVLRETCSGTSGRATVRISHFSTPTCCSHCWLSRFVSLASPQIWLTNL